MLKLFHTRFILLAATPMAVTRSKLTKRKPLAAASSSAKPQTASVLPNKIRWTFLTNHAHVLFLLSQDSSTVLREVALRIGITERAVQRIIADLEQEGFIEREKIGRKNSYQIRSELPLRHPIEAHRTIGNLIELIGTKR